MAAEGGLRVGAGARVGVVGRDKLTAEGVRAGRCYKSRTRQPALYPLGGYLVRG